MWMLVKLPGSGRLYINFDTVKFIAPGKDHVSYLSFLDGTERTVDVDFDDLMKQIENLRNFMRGS
ncbi:hypothetical protein [Agrobacterium pusense]|uniref:hypothetical protein n=1 Tax=Agrobacterium pusense TaxID=648995 RepID=UPI001AE5B2C4|nr:hypothetical protein [Agrobacterium pusense]MBP2611403.1 hypothetical protein [Agrobacterium pusense]